MIDGTNTTADWQREGPDICVWGVGSFEQHGPHLPLATDNLEIEYFARIAAEALNAALLPSLPIGTCLEMTGFAGSLTFRPETLMAVVRDVVDAVEAQGFRTMILLNGHGGNHCLVPVVRDLNRGNRPLKIILANFWEFADPNLAPPPEHGPSFHADAWETSLMLALHPELVRDQRVNAPIPKAPLRQSDLTTFGIGHFHAAGSTGHPGAATREWGEKIVASIIANLIPHLQDRRQRLHADRDYQSRKR